MFRLSKSRLIAGLQCRKRLHLQIHHPELAQNEETIAIRQGNAVGELARRMFGKGVLIDGGSLSNALIATQAALARGDAHIYEATFQAQDLLVRVDALSRSGTGYDVTEVKASTEVKPHHLDDAAIQAWVLHEAGIPVQRTRIAHIDNNFVYPGADEYEGLLAVIDVTDKIGDRIAKVPTWLKDMNIMLGGPEPVVDVGNQCKNPVPCEFAGHCDPYKAVDHRPDILPRISGKMLAGWRGNGVFSLADVPDEDINALQARVRLSHLNGESIQDEKLGSELRSLGFPRYFIDFETVNPAIPLFAGTRPYQHLVFQWSCHRMAADGHVIHSDYLATGMTDPRPEFVKSLIESTGTAGPVFVWNASFEKTRLRELARAYPQHREQLETIIERVLDLLPIFRSHYYHPEMNGSWSIKAVLPTIAPELSYDSLNEVRDGGAAMDAFYEFVAKGTSDERRHALRSALLEYCKRDTLAMVTLVTKCGAAHA